MGGRKYYRVPICAQGILTRDNYVFWLRRESRAIYQRFGIYSQVKPQPTCKEIVEQINTLAHLKGYRCYYTNVLLDWSLLLYSERLPKRNRRNPLLSKFDKMPAVDIALQPTGKYNLRICSWLVAEMKYNVLEPEFIDICSAISLNMKLPRWEGKNGKISST